MKMKEYTLASLEKEIKLIDSLDTLYQFQEILNNADEVVDFSTSDLWQIFYALENRFEENLQLNIEEIDAIVNEYLDFFKRRDNAQ